MINLLNKKYISLCYLILTFFLFVTQGGFAQINVNGKVLDEAGYPLKGVIISQNEVIIDSTDADGTFSITMNEQNSLLFDLHGFKFYEEKYTGNSEMIITMKKDPFQKTVNIAYGQQKLMDLTSAVSTTSGEDIDKIPVQTLSNALQGMLPGLIVLQTSGEPGADIPEMHIRGLKTYNDNSILIFVDGFESTFDHLLASEIESVTVLKDAASLAPFGMRGANGVLWVTTKRGIEGNARITLNSKVGFSQPVQLPKFLGSADYARLYNEAISNDAGIWSPVYSADDINKYSNGTDPLFFPNVNWYDEILQNQVPYSETNLSFRGGSPLIKYFILLGYKNADKLYKQNQYDQTGVLENTGSMNRYNLRSNIDAKLSDIFSLSLDLGGAIQNSFFPNIDNIWDILSLYPPNIYQPINPDGSWGGNAIYPDNPAASIYAKGLKSRHDMTFQTAFTLHENLNFITKGLSFSQSIAFTNWFQGNYDRKRDYARFEPYLDDDSIMYYQFMNETDFSIDESLYQQWRRVNFATNINYDRNYGLNNISALLTYRQNRYIIGGNEVPYLHNGIAGRVSYNYNQEYFTEFSFGFNGSENFPQGKRYGFFPAISAGWMLSKEEFFNSLDWIDILKIRASAGIIGNDRYGAGRFLYQQYYPDGDDFILGWDGTRSVGSYTEGAIGNPDIRWESSFQFNIGFDSRMFKNRLDLSFDYFNDRRTDILGKREASIPLILGIELPYENMGKVSCSGFETSVMFSDKIQDFEYFIGGNLSLSHNKIKYMDEITRREEYLYRTGNPVGQPFGLEAIGFYQSWDEINDANTPVPVFSAIQPGDIKYKDQNNDGLINEDDEMPIGFSDVPEIYYSMNLGLKWKGFDISALLYGVANRSILLDGDYAWAFLNNGQVPEMAKNRWAYYPSEGIDTRATATYPRLSTQYNENNYRLSSFWQKSGNYLRFRNIEVGYTITNKVAKKLAMNSFRIYLSGNNLFTFSDIEDFDPEVMTGYPLLKSYNIGLNLSF